MTDPDTPPWRVLRSNRILANPWFSVLQRDVELPSGRVIDFQSVQFAGPAVGVIPRRAGQILLLRQYRLTIDRYVWAIPSGGVDPGESAADAARRELLEEAGLAATELRPVIAYHPSYGASDQLFQTFVAEEPADTDAGFDRDEVMQHRWFEQAEVQRMLFANELIDGLSATPLAMLFLEDQLRAAGQSVTLDGTLPDR